MRGSNDTPQHPIGVAMEWVSRIMAIAMEMVLPGLGGQWLDQRLGTSFLVLVGFGFGLTAGIWHLLLLAKQSNQRKKSEPSTNARDEQKSEGSSGSSEGSS